MNITLFVIIAFFVLFALRMSSRVLLFAKMGWSWKQAIIPVGSHIFMAERIGLKREAFICSVLRIVGLILCAGTLLAQYYLSQYYMTHFYGIMLGNFSVPDYGNLWNILSTIGALVGVFGIAGRLIVCKKLSRLFGCTNKLVNFIGMLFPSIYELYLSLSRKYVWLMQRPTHHMTSEEYAMYCAMLD
jgi:hypothetical protein